MNEYDDIINLPHYVSKTHTPMSMMNRAAQFAPFAALTGHAAAIEETARLTEEQMELADDDNAILNQKMAYLRENLPEHPIVTVTYFEEDGRKAGGAYKTIKAPLKNIDDYTMSLVMKTGEVIPLKAVFDVRIEN